MSDSLSAIRAASEALTALDPLPFPLPVDGLEAVIAGGFEGLERTDWVLPGLRERVGAVLRGCPVERLADPAEGARPYRVAPASGDPAARALHAVGLAMARPDEAALCFLGQGSAGCGAFHEALNLAALYGARVIFLLTCLELDEGAPVGPQLAADPADLAAAFGLHTQTLDAPDVAAVRGAVAAARAAGGPALIAIRLRPGAEPALTDRDDLGDKTVAELRRLARDAGLSGYSRMKKAELIAALR